MRPMTVTLPLSRYMGIVAAALGLAGTRRPSPIPYTNLAILSLGHRTAIMQASLILIRRLTYLIGLTRRDGSCPSPAMIRWQVGSSSSSEDSTESLRKPCRCCLLFLCFYFG